jgi:hypothetical protein
VNYELVKELVLFEFAVLVAVHYKVAWCLWVAGDEDLGEILLQLLICECGVEGVSL